MGAETEDSILKMVAARSQTLNIFSNREPTQPTQAEALLKVDVPKRRLPKLVMRSNPSTADPKPQSPKPKSLNPEPQTQYPPWTLGSLYESSAKVLSPEAWTTWTQALDFLKFAKYFRVEYGASGPTISLYHVTTPPPRLGSS